MNLLRHPIVCGLGVEAALVGTFLLFPVGSCNAPLPGVIVLHLHYPAFLFSQHVLHLTTDAQHLVVAPLLMAAVWISMAAAVRRLLPAKKTHSDEIDPAS